MQKKTAFFVLNVIALVGPIEPPSNYQSDNNLKISKMPLQTSAIPLSAEKYLLLKCFWYQQYSQQHDMYSYQGQDEPLLLKSKLRDSGDT